MAAKHKQHSIINLNISNLKCPIKESLDKLKCKILFSVVYVNLFLTPRIGIIYSEKIENNIKN